MRKKKKKQQKFVDFFFFCLPNNLRQLLNIDKSMMLNLMFSALVPCTWWLNSLFICWRLNLTLSHSFTHFVDQKAQSFKGDWNSKNVYCPVDKNFIDYKVHLSTLLRGNPVWLIAMSLWCGYLHFWFKSWVGFFFKHS